MVLNDATQALHFNEVSCKKYQKKHKMLLIIILVLSNLLVTVSTGSLTYLYTKEKVSQVQSMGGQHGHLESIGGHGHNGHNGLMSGLNSRHWHQEDRHGQQGVLYERPEKEPGLTVRIEGRTDAMNMTTAETKLGSIWG